ncbi:cytochrome C biosynthesis protein [Novosphingobium fuchskuhlense]|uniref:Cytochrome C biosynthesis protein n=1 Tax=Novosphingobium fuchskuhlense TaxID=1117702 RepID=A0A117UVI5_9SPHN|nr:tetratricopeptide repeat protein [Novosphingobium fuchskuhlense]KUR71608.1 cytochrome C biosynthesis protein [Novosphingobium fuchskuhlense]
MTWVLILVIALVVLGVMVFLLKLPRTGWEITAAALLFGIAGYALQGHPGQPGAPQAPVENARLTDQTLLKERQQMGAGFGQGQSWLILADALTRQGQFGAASDVLRKAIAKSPQDADLWVALGNALVGHTEGVITPAAQFAFQKAANIAPDHPGPPFFMGLALAQTGRLAEARVLWAQLLARSPADAPYRPDLQSRLQQLDSMIAEQARMQGGMAGAPAAPPPGAKPAQQ